jgi:hypothetical protein
MAGPCGAYRTKCRSIDANLPLLGTAVSCDTLSAGLRSNLSVPVPGRGREGLESAHPRHCRTLRRRSLDRTDSGRLSLAAGTAHVCGPPSWCIDSRRFVEFTTYARQAVSSTRHPPSSLHSRNTTLSSGRDFLMSDVARQITNSWATPRASISKSRPCTGGRAKCQVKPPGWLRGGRSRRAKSGWMLKIV